MRPLLRPRASRPQLKRDPLGNILAFSEEQPTTENSGSASQVKADLKGVFAQLGPQTELGRARRALLPGWIKFFSWLFLLVSAGVPIAVLTGIVSNTPISFTLFGFRYVGTFNVQAALLAIAIVGCGSTAYGLLWGRSWGLFAGALTGWGGLALSVASIFVSTPGLHLPLEPLLLIPFLIKLSDLRKGWREEAGD